MGENCPRYNKAFDEVYHSPEVQKEEQQNKVGPGIFIIDFWCFICSANQSNHHTHFMAGWLLFSLRPEK